jgi:ankyrin repeat protein
MSTASTQRSTTILRVKRPRSVDAVPTLQLARKRARLVQDLTKQISSAGLNDNETMNGGQQLTAGQALLVFQRIPDLKSIKDEKSVKRHVIDATLELSPSKSDAKRPRLTLLVKPSQPKQPRGHRVLDPLTRLVDEKLKKVQEGSESLQHYLNFLQQDPRVDGEMSKFLRYKLQDGSSVLHLAALWNCVEEARYLLLNFAEMLDINGLDSSGQTPLQIAQQAGNDGMVQVLEAFGADDFTYDVFVLDHDSNEEDFELKGGVGYIDEQGRLILEDWCPEDSTADYQEDVEEAVHEDDVDSNAEDYEFNDYPDEESDSDVDEATDFRHDPIYGPIYMPRGTTMTQSYSYPNDDLADEYDVQYGLYDGAGDGRRMYAYDPNLDQD